MTGRVSRARRAAAALAAAVGLLATAACTGDGRAAGPDTSTAVVPPTTRTAPVSTASGAGLAGRPELGLKWNWTQQATLKFVGAEPPGPTFTEVEWCQTEPSRGQYRWGPTDNIVNRSLAMGYSVMLKIRVGAGCWGASGGGAAVRDPQENTRKTPSEFPTDTAGYTAFVTALVSRYAALGVHRYAVENEVDAANFWSGTAQEYVALVALAAPAIKAADAQATVLDAGISSTGYGVAMAAELLAAGKDDEAVDLYQHYYARRQAGRGSRFPVVGSAAELRSLLGQARVKAVVDMVDTGWQVARSGDTTAYQLHFYEGPQLAASLLDFVRAHIGDRLPIQGWEVGLAWPGSDFSLDRQAVEVAQLLGYLYAEGVTPLVYLPLAFTPGDGKEEIFRGLIAPDGSAYPAAAAYQVVASAAAASTQVASLSAEGWSGAVFLGAVRSKALVWRSAGTAASFTASADVDTITGLDGREVGSASTAPVLLSLSAGDAASAGAALTTALGVEVSLR